METKNKKDIISYSLGVVIAGNLKKQGLDSLNPDYFTKGIMDIFHSNPLMISNDSANKILSEYTQEVQKARIDENIKKGNKFLEENGKRKGVVTLPSGLQYEVMKEGDGPKPMLTDKVTTHYHGTLIDGTVFDSSRDRGQAATFPVNGVIQGWVEALQLMKTGSKWKLFVPYNLGYGEKQAGPNIPAYSTLIFEVDLLSIEKTDATNPNQK